jgi:hypothetical protein
MERGSDVVRRDVKMRGRGLTWRKRVPARRRGAREMVEGCRSWREAFVIARVIISGDVMFSSWRKRTRGPQRNC